MYQKEKHINERSFTVLLHRFELFINLMESNCNRFFSCKIKIKDKYFLKATYKVYCKIRNFTTTKNIKFSSFCKVIQQKIAPLISE